LNKQNLRRISSELTPELQPPILSEELSGYSKVPETRNKPLNSSIPLSSMPLKMLSQKQSSLPK